MDLIDLKKYIKMKNSFKFGRIEKKDTMAVVDKMMTTPMNELPEISIDYLKFLSSKYGFCGEMCVTAYAHYCQAVLGLPCDNPDYKINNEGTTWFNTPKIT